MLDLLTRRRVANDMALRSARDLRRSEHLHFPFLCECVDPTCRELVFLTLSELDQARRDGSALLCSSHTRVS